MHEAALYLCSVFCSRSPVQLSTVSYCVWSAEHAPNCIPSTLRVIINAMTKLMTYLLSKSLIAPASFDVADTILDSLGTTL